MGRNESRNNHFELFKVDDRYPKFGDSVGAERPAGQQMLNSD